MRPNRAEINLNVRKKTAPPFLQFEFLQQSMFHKLLFYVPVGKAYSDLTLFQKKHDVNPLRGFLVPLVQVSLSAGT